ncbi:MAG: hypothetical protein HFI26_06200 [Lachnospiraceae bacterium]|jgi:uncharacterized protein YukE|nr:hypothetical protein [Lachnospiraceae bacterium]
MDNIRINYETVSSVIGSLKQAVAGSQSELEGLYETAATAIEEYKGEEAEALREVLRAEKELMEEACTFLQKFAESIQFVTDELNTLDNSGASHMAGLKRGYLK